MMELLADSIAQSGVTFTPVAITALDAWTQFFKNIPIALIAFVLLESGVFTREYQTGTLLLSLTKGLARPKAVIAKTAVLAALWTAGYWLCVGITYGYSAYFWDNAATRSLGFSVACWWLFGLWAVALLTLFSTIAKSNTGVLAGTGGVALACLLLGMIPRIGQYLPTRLMDGSALIYGQAGAQAYAAAIAVTAVMVAACFAGSLILFNKKQI